VDRILNVSAYLFVAIDEPATLRERLLASARAAGLKGTLLIAGEGINLFLAGPAPALRGWIDELRADPRFTRLEPKESWSDGVPFRRLLVKCKREIIRMNHPAVRPQQGRAPAVDAPTLARWLDAGQDDAGRPLVLLDTRNAFEVDAGKFRGAVDLGLSRFSDFPAAAEARLAEWTGHTVVSYCTGGIRCEKAAIHLAGAGVAQVLQLDGGILKYFELVGGRHFEGQCFVFDERISLDAALAPAPAAHALPVE
jgi:UPF0176 protein